MKAFTKLIEGVSSNTKYISDLFSDRSKYTRLLFQKLNQIQKFIFLLIGLCLLSSAFIAGQVVTNTVFDKIPSSFVSREPQYVPSKGVGAEDISNNAKNTLKNFITLIRNSLESSDNFLKAVYSERPLYLESDTISIGGESFQSPKKLIYGSALGIAFSLITLFIIFDTFKILMGHGGDLKKLFFRYLIGIFIVSLSGVILNYSIDIANAVTKDLLVNNSDPNKSKIGQILDDYLKSVQDSYKDTTEWPWEAWFGEKAVWNPINILKDFFQIAIALIPLIALLLVVLANGFALLTNWVVMYVLSGIMPIAIAFYMVDWGHDYPRNFWNLWLQNLLQLPLFSFVFGSFISFLGGGISAGSPFKLALFFAFLMVMLNVNQNFGSIFTGLSSQIGNSAGNLFAGLGTSAISSAGSSVRRSFGQGGIARQVAGGVGTQALKLGSNFVQGVGTGKGSGVSGRVGQSVNSFGQGMIGNRTSSYVANRLGRMTGSLGVESKNVATGLRATGDGVQKVSKTVSGALKNTVEKVQSMKTNPAKTSLIGLDPLKNQNSQTNTTNN